VFADYAPRLFELGWRNLLPLTHGKGTRVKWGPLQHKDMTEATLAYFLKKYGDAPRVGFVFGPSRDLVAIDIDVEDPVTAKQIASLGHTLPFTEFVRIGRYPKALVLYRGKVQSRKMHPIEVFGSSGQVAVFGMHPSTGKPYRWPDKSIMDHGPDELPLVTQEQVDAFLLECRRFVKPSDRAGKTIEWTNDEEMADERRAYGSHGAARQLMRVTKGNRHITLLSIVGWCVNKGYSPEEIAAFVDEFFPQHLRTRERGDDWTNPAARAEEMAHSAIAKWSDKEWAL
jgi:hypothetical protein